VEYQEIELRQLLSRARNTRFGEHYGFSEILRTDRLMRTFRERVPVFDYDHMYEEWWHRALDEEKDVSWPGRIPYFALTSGTSGAPSKHVPVTTEMIRSVRKAGIKQIYSLAAFHLPDEMFEKDILILGGSTQLTRRGSYSVGDLSGISAGQIPIWFQHFYKPGPKIAVEHDWNRKLEAITRQAGDWDVGIICGVPSWMQLLLEKIIDYYEVETIHEIWPNLSVFVHGGVAFGPYRKTVNRLVARPLVTIDTYIASEGHIAFQDRPGGNMRMLVNNGIFFEFVPFTEENFTADGRLVEQPEAVTIDEVEEGTPYALLLSTCAGAWRYLVGDVVRFTDREAAEIVIVGRTKHFLNLCGEHLSADNMAQAVQRLEDQFDIAIPEFTVAGVPRDGLFAHSWFLGTETGIDDEVLRQQLDENLKAVNDDYAIKRGHVLKEPRLETVPVRLFYGWMERQGKLGGQHKFPRVLNQSQLAEWQEFVRERMNAE
jgi:hypothetical protein